MKIKKKGVYFILGFVLLASSLLIINAIVDTDKAWHDSSEILITIDGYKMTLQEAITNNVFVDGVIFIEFKSPTATGEDYTGWVTNPTYAYASDDQRAFTPTGPATQQDYYDFSFGVPSGATIDGIEVSYEGYDEYANNEIIVELSWNGGASYTSEDMRISASELGDEAINEKTTIIGSPTYTWGRTWSSSEFSDANFRIRIQMANAGQVACDHLQVKVYYAGEEFVPTIEVPNPGHTADEVWVSVNGDEGILQEAIEKTNGLCGFESTPYSGPQDKLKYQFANEIEVSSGVSLQDAIDSGEFCYGPYFWITDRFEDKIYKYSMNGAYISSFNTTEENNNPKGIATNGNYLWITDTDDKEDEKVYKYSMTGIYEESWDLATENSMPWGITTDGISLWVLDRFFNDVYKYDMNGSYLSFFDDPPSANVGMHGITTNGTYIWAVQDSYFIGVPTRVHKYDMNGAYTGENWIPTGGNDYPYGITTDGNYFWLVASDGIYKYDMNGAYTGESWDTSVSGNNYPGGITISYEE